MSNPIPEEVREAMARAIARVEHDSFQVGGVGEGLAELDPEAAFDCYVDHVDAALSALEAAGWVCVQDDAVRHFASAIEKHERRIVEFYLSPLRDEHFATITWPNGEQTVIPVTAFRAMLTASRHKEG